MTTTSTPDPEDVSKVPTEPTDIVSDDGGFYESDDPNDEVVFEDPGTEQERTEAILARAAAERAEMGLADTDDAAPVKKSKKDETPEERRARRHELLMSWPVLGGIMIGSLFCLLLGMRMLYPFFQ